VRFLTRGVQQHHKKLFGKNTCQKPNHEVIEDFFCHLLPSVLLSFFSGSLHEGLKNTTEIFFCRAGNKLIPSFG
jgi:hypothetical protein